MTLVRALRDYVKPPDPLPKRTPSSQECCEICSTPLTGGHPHVLEYATRSLLCSCDPCARLFVDTRASNGRFRTIPDRVLSHTLATVDEALWRTIGIPVGLAFVVRESGSSTTRCVYPSPAGPVESEFEEGRWTALASVVPLARAVERDVEALLLRRRRDGALDCLVAPLDACYAMVGAVRTTWRGFDGGDEARRAIEEHVDSLLARGQRVVSGAIP
jgi:hypothetical protein